MKRLQTIEKEDCSMEERKEVKAFEVDYKCPKCDIGYLRSDGERLLCYPPLYPHKCSNKECDYSEKFRFNYPYIDYEIINK